MGLGSFTRTGASCCPPVYACWYRVGTTQTNDRPEGRPFVREFWSGRRDLNPRPPVPQPRRWRSPVTAESYPEHESPTVTGGSVRGRSLRLVPALVPGETPMTRVPDQVLARLDELIALGEKMPHSGDAFYASHEALVSWRAACTAWLERVIGANDAYTREFKTAADGWYYSAATSGTGVLRHVRQDIGEGYLTSMSALVAAELVADVWEQSAELLDGGYKDAAASVAGAALEAGLRRVVDAKGITPTGPRGIGSLNAALAGAGVYNALRQRQVDAWRELRNAAAHGDYGAFTESDVRGLIEGGRALLADIFA